MTNTFLERLRSDTNEMHRSLEKNSYAIKLMSESVTVEDYAAYLEKMYGFIAVFEEIILPQVTNEFPDVEPKASLLETDILRLGKHVSEVQRIPAESIEEIYPSSEAMLGGLYVMEGSTLGGMVIYKHLYDHLGEAIENKASFFTVYGKTTGSRWKNFLEHFCVLADSPQKEKAIIEGAVNTFRLLDEWMNTVTDNCDFCTKA